MITGYHKIKINSNQYSKNDKHPETFIHLSTIPENFSLGKLSDASA